MHAVLLKRSARDSNRRLGLIDPELLTTKAMQAVLATYQESVKKVRYLLNEIGILLINQ